MYRMGTLEMTADSNSSLVDYDRIRRVRCRGSNAPRHSLRNATTATGKLGLAGLRKGVLI